MRNLLNITDLSVFEIDEIISLAEDIMSHRTKYATAMQGKILGTLFFEPSTRTRLSFESAILSLGGTVMGFSNAANSSTAKGERCSDTVRTVSAYVDMIVMRHPLEGAAYVASQVSDVPIINAGDGGHHHPTQTLTDLLTIHREKGRLDNMVIGLCGDLKYGRTVHSLIDAMIRYKNVRFVLISPAELRVPDYVIATLKKNDIEYIETTSLEDAMPNLDILYMTRIQRERFLSGDEYERLKDSYILTTDKLKRAKSDMKILHPLPRVNEIAQAVDSDERACYFKQVKYGRFVRMALILKLNEWININLVKVPQHTVIDEYVCENPKCITVNDFEMPHVFVETENKGEYKCVYCEKIATSKK